MGLKKVSITVDKLKPGMVVAEDIRAYGMLLVSEGVEINEKIISKLKEKFYQSTVKVICDENEELEPTSTKVPEFKEKTVEDVDKNFNVFSKDIEDIFSNLDYHGKPDINEVRSFAKKIQDELESPSIVIKNIVLYGSGVDSIFRHSVNVAALSSIFGKWLGFNDNEISLLTYSAILHDFGKTKIDKDILNKQGKLTSKEWEVIKSHPVIAYNNVKEIPFLDQSVAYGALMHHERLDGSGYPLGIKDDKIHPFAKVIAIADTFDAVNSNRVYKKSKDPFSALEVIQKDSLGKLDYNYARIFVEHIINYYIGESVLLSDGRVCKIIKIDPNNLSQPLLLHDSEFIDLKHRKEITLEKLVL